MASSSKKTGSLPLAEADPELSAMIEKERDRQFRGLELIASENFASHAVLDALGSVLTNKYSEGMPGRRYYGGNEFIDQIERLCQTRALKAFGVAPADEDGDKEAASAAESKKSGASAGGAAGGRGEWGVNVQPLSGSPANFAVYTALLQPHDRIMGLDLPSGGHLTHGFYTAKKKISATSVFFESFPYQVSDKTGLVDYDVLERDATMYRPRMIVCGGSAYPRDWDYARLRAIADKVGALLMCDMAHFSGLVAAGLLLSPFDYCDVVTTTTHKSLRGPRSGMIFYRKDTKRVPDMESRINWAVFPALQGGPHNHQIAAVATQMREVATPEFRRYAEQIVKNARALAAALMESGYKLQTGGTDTHLILWDLRPLGITGSKMETVCDLCSLTLNKNSVFGDRSAMSPGGVRIGTPALTTRGFVEADFVKVAAFLKRAADLAVDIQGKSASKKLTDFKAAIKESDEFGARIKTLREDVETFASKFYMPGRPRK